MNNTIKHSNALREKGYLVVSSLTLDGFMEIGNALGSVTQKTEVRLDDQSNQYPHCPEKVPFHTDHPEVPTVGWHCISQDADDGTSLLIDTKSIVDKMSEEELQVARGIQLRMFHRETTRSLFNKEPYCFYWLPVIVGEFLEKANESESACIERIYALIEEEEQIRIRLAPGEALFVNNNRMLHGREVIGDASERNLLRAYIA